MHNSLKDKVLESIDIVDVIGERVALKRKGKDLYGLCPFHPDHNPSMSVSGKKQIFKCWSCGVGGDVIKFVQLKEKVDFGQALRLLAERAGISVEDRPEARAEAQSRDQLRRAVEWARRHFRNNLAEHTAGRAALDYARRRGLSEDTIAQFGLGFAPDGWSDLLTAAQRAGLPNSVLTEAGLITTNESGRTYDRFRNRLIFPICDGMGRPVAFGGRTLGDDPAKYLNSPETPLFSKSRILYALDHAREGIEKADAVVIVEGYMDAVLLHQHGFANVVATLGTALTDAHVKLLKPLTETFYLCFDGDEAGMKAADRAVEAALRHRVQVRVVILRPEEDPADCVVSHGAAAFSGLLQTAVDALEFKWTLTAGNIDRRDLRARRIAAERMLEFIASTAAAGGLDPLQQGVLIGRLSELLSLPPGTVYEALGRTRASARREVSSETPDTSPILSAYDASTQGLPAALVASVEDMFGVALVAPAAFGWDDDAYCAALSHVEPWRRLDALCRSIYERDGTLSREEVLAGCDDAALCELMTRVCARSAAQAAPEAVFEAARARLSTELDLLHMGELRGELRAAQATPSAADVHFRALLDAARRQHAVLPAQSRWDAAARR